MAKIQKRRNFEIITYDLDKEKTLQRLKSLSYIVKYAFIVHDKDVYDEEDERNNPEHINGKLKPAHMHIMIACNNTYDPKRIAKDFDIPLNRLQFIKSSYAHAVRYLTHETAPDKFIYPVDELVCNFDYKQIKKKDTHKDVLKSKKEDLIRDIMDGNVKKYNLSEHFAKYDIDPLYMVKWRKDIETAFSVRVDKMTNQTDRTLEVIYIQGKSGTGKTTLGKILAKKRGYEICITSGNNKDILSAYQGQPCLLVDDPSRETFSSWNEALKLLDNHTSSSYKSRYYDKSLVELKLLIITSTLSIDELFNYHKIEMKQLHRRIPTLIRLDRLNAHVLAYDLEKDLYTTAYSFKNPLDDYLKEIHVDEDEEVSNSLDWIKEEFKV